MTTRRDLLKGLAAALAASALPPAVMGYAPPVASVVKNPLSKNDWIHVVIEFDADKPSSRMTRVWINGDQVESIEDQIFDMGCHVADFIRPSERVRRETLAVWTKRSPDGRNMYMADAYYVEGAGVGPEEFGEMVDGVWTPRRRLRFGPNDAWIGGDQPWPVKR